jgi:hypothetical protein
MWLEPDGCPLEPREKRDRKPREGGFVNGGGEREKVVASQPHGTIFNQSNCKAYHQVLAA